MADKTYPQTMQQVTSIRPSDVGGRYYVEVEITPELPQDRMVKAQLAAAWRTPGVDGLPLVDDQTIREDVLQLEAPDQVRRRVAEQMLPAQSQKIQQLQMAAYERQWRESNPTLVELAEEEMNPEGLPSLSGEQMKQLLALMQKHEQAQASGQPGLQELLAQVQAGGGGVPAGMAGMGGAPPGVDPSVMPSQFGMTQGMPMPSLDELVASQSRRGKAQH